MGKKPNILITGTPGVGKSKICEQIAKECGFQLQNVSKIAIENDFELEYDATLESPVLDEDKVLDFLEPIMSKGGNIVEYHGSDLFPERWFQAVFVIRCNNTELFDRLTARGYNKQKIDNNVQCEIFQTLLEEALDSYDKDIVFELQNTSESEFDECISSIKSWINKHK